MTYILNEWYFLVFFMYVGWGAVGVRATVFLGGEHEQNSLKCQKEKSSFLLPFCFHSFSSSCEREEKVEYNVTGDIVPSFVHFDPVEGLTF